MRRSIKVIIILAMVLLDLFLVIPLVVPIRPMKGLVPPGELADPDSQFISLNGIDFHYKSAGDQGPAVILLHGFGASQYSWRLVLPLLGEDYRVFAYDRPAFGLTERPVEWTGDNPYTRAASIDQLDQLIAAWDAEPVILVGNSAGGTVAMEYTLAHPAQVSALILVSPAVSGGNKLLTKLAFLVDAPQTQRVGPLLVRRIARTGSDTINQAWHDPSKQPEDTLALYTKPLQAENWDVALWHFSTTGEISDLPERLDEFTLPILVITGDDDRIVPTEDSIEVANQLPGAELVVLPNCGHVPQEECPQAFMEAVSAFIGRLDP